MMTVISRGSIGDNRSTSRRRDSVIRPYHWLFLNSVDPPSVTCQKGFLVVPVERDRAGRNESHLLPLSLAVNQGTRQGVGPAASHGCLAGQLPEGSYCGELLSGNVMGAPMQRHGNGNGVFTTLTQH